MEPLKKIQVEGFAMFAEPELLFGNLDELCCVSVLIKVLERVIVSINLINLVDLGNLCFLQGICKFIATKCGNER